MSQGKDGGVKNMQFILDTPISNRNDDEFQLRQVADLLQLSLESENPPKHIALLGNWGSGKTSVLQLMKIQMERLSRKVEFLNVWKFADDSPSLHRKIVKEIQRVLDVNDEEGLDVETSTTGTTEGSGAFSFLIKAGKWENRWGFLTLLVVALIIACDYLSLKLHNNVPVIISVLFWFILTQSQFRTALAVTKKRYQAIHRDQFEGQFSKAVEKYFKNNPGTKYLVLVFDDLDRLPPPQMLAALNTIRTFLNAERCSFVVPCDEMIVRDAIKEELSQSGSGDPEIYIPEYLNKLFDITLRLPALERTNMKRYAKTLISKHPLEWADHKGVIVDLILSILIHSGVRTPRQVKHLLNTFTADWRLAETRDLSGGNNLLTSQPYELAFMSVLKCDFPDFYQDYVAGTTNPIKVLNEESLHQPTPDTGSAPSYLRYQELQAFLARTKSYVPKDPRQFMYFSNQELNPLTGRPELNKVLSYFLDNQVDKFPSAFTSLSQDERHVVLRALSDELEYDTTLELENCINVLVNFPEIFDDLPKDYYTEWDSRIQRNVTTLLRFSVTDVCELLDHMDATSETWRTLGQEILQSDTVSTFHEELLELWSKKEPYVKKLGLTSGLGEPLKHAYITNKHPWKLCEALLSIPQLHSMGTAIDWWAILKEGAQSEQHVPFSLVEWLKAWTAITGQVPTASMIAEFATLYSDMKGDGLKGLGKLWCEVYDQDQYDSLSHMLTVLSDKGNTVFADESLQQLGKILCSLPTEDSIHHKVTELLTNMWTTDEGYVESLVQNLGCSYGVCSFIAQIFNGDLNERTLNIFTTILASGDIKHDYRGGVLDKFNRDINASLQTRNRSKLLPFLKRLVDFEPWSKEASRFLPSWFPTQDPMYFLRIMPNAFEDRVDMITMFFPLGDGYQTWLIESVNKLGETIRGTVQGLPYGAHASNYLQTLIVKIAAHPLVLDWNKGINAWGDARVIELLSDGTKQYFLSQLTKYCSISNSTFNGWLATHADFGIEDHRRALVNRWLSFVPEMRKTTMDRIQGEDIETLSEFVKQLHHLYKVHSEPRHIDEMRDWVIDREHLAPIVKTIATSCSMEVLVEWIDAHMQRLVEVEDYWVLLTCKHAWLNRQDASSVPSVDILKRLLHKEDSRAELALLVLEKNFEGRKLKQFRDEIDMLRDSYPEIVESLRKSAGFRFRREPNKRHAVGVEQ